MNQLPTIPSRWHQERASTLECIGHLAGHHVVATVPTGALRPDVLLRRVDYRAVFIGEAKHSEPPTDRYAVARLRSSPSHRSSWLRKSQ
jgi:hypothetical protein